MQCNDLSKKFVKLGGHILERIQNEKDLLNLYLQEDFKGRNLMSIITTYSFRELFLDEKIAHLINTIWYGQEYMSCTGKWSDFSQLIQLGLYTPKVTNRNIGSTLMIRNKFKAVTNKQHLFQYHYRRQWTSFLYAQDFLFSLLFVIFFQISNYYYIDLFNQGNYNDLSREEAEKKADERLEDYRYYIYINMILVIILFMQLFLKLVYNVVARRKLNLDKWTSLDILTAVTNTVAIITLSTVTAEQILDDVNNLLDYYIIAIVVIAWIRFFMLFFLINVLSPLIHTLFMSIVSTLAFICIMLCYMVIASTVFYTLYVDIKPSQYATFFLSFRSLMGAMLDYTDFDDLGSRELSFSILIHIHIFIAGVLLMNFLIAIITTVFEDIRQTGDFSYQSNVYQYSDKYIQPILDRNFTELACHPAPMSLIGYGLIPFICSPTTARKVGQWLGLIVFWLENIAIILAFFIYLLILMPFIYIRMFLNILRATIHPKMKILCSILWILIGLCILFIICFKDTIVFIMLLTKNVKVIKENEEESQRRIIGIYNEVLDSMNAFLVQLKAVGHIFSESDKIGELFKHMYEKSCLVEDEESSKCLKVDPMLLLKYFKDRREEGEEKAKIAVEKLCIKEGYNMGSKGLVLAIKKRERGALEEVKRSKGKKATFSDMLNYLGKKLGRDEKNKGGEFSRTTTGMHNDKYLSMNDLDLAAEFLGRFILKSLELKEQITIKIVISCLPKFINLQNINIVEGYNFRLIQNAIVEYQNNEVNELFEHYDQINLQRIKDLKRKLNEVNAKVKKIDKIETDLALLTEHFLH